MCVRRNLNDLNIFNSKQSQKKTRVNYQGPGPLLNRGGLRDRWQEGEKSDMKGFHFFVREGVRIIFKAKASGMPRVRRLFGSVRGLPLKQTKNRSPSMSNFFHSCG